MVPRSGAISVKSRRQEHSLAHVPGNKRGRAVGCRGEFPEFPGLPESPEFPEFPEFPESPESPEFPEPPTHRGIRSSGRQTRVGGPHPTEVGGWRPSCRACTLPVPLAA